MAMIKLFNLSSVVEQVQAEVLAQWKKALDQCEFTYGEYVQLLETKAAKFFETNYALGVASGTASLITALRAVGIKPGDEVITTPLSFCASADAILHVQARPVFVDVLPETGNIDPQHIEQALTKKTRAVLIVHLYGVPCQLQPITQLIKKHNLILIEDASHAHGSLYRGRSVGGWGEAGCISLYPSKTLGAFGNAGLIVTQDKQILERARMYANHGVKKGEDKYLHYLHGYNELIDNLQAAVVLARFKGIEQRIERRLAIARRYNQVFHKHGLPGMMWPDDTLPSLYVYAAQIPHRERFINFLTQQEIESGIYYRLPIHLQPAYQDLGYQQGDLPVAEKFFNQTLSLPLRADLTEAEIATITQAIDAYFA